MKILFLLPTIDFGRDGIADYTSRLADYCRKENNEVELVPLGRNDWIKKPRALAKTLEQATSRIRGFSPDAISWQFDPRIFHPRAVVPAGIVPDFSRFAKRVQLMAHETWEGDEEGASVKRRLKGALQRHGVLAALRKIHPHITHASSPLYLHHLDQAHVPSKLLPLFSSVPVIGSDSDARQDYGADTLSMVIFGGFRDHWEQRELLGKLRDSGRNWIFHHVGRNSEHEKLVEFRKACSGWSEFIEHGEQTPTQISKLFLNCHFAISTYNLLHLQKSSIYATFVDHGLPVIVPRRDATHARIPGFRTPVPEGVILLDDLPEAIQAGKRLPVGDSLPQRGAQFLRDITT